MFNKVTRFCYLLVVALPCGLAAQPFEPVLEVTDLDGTNGFAISGEHDGGSMVVAAAGDIDADGHHEILIGDSSVAVDGDIRGAAYVIQGRDTPFPPVIALETLDSPDGFMVRGYRDFNWATGRSVSDAGDVNGDGIDDFLVAMPGSNRPDGGKGFCCYGSIYLVFGRSEFPRVFSLEDFSAEDGVIFDGEDYFDEAGNRVAGLGDVNGDGLSDIAIGAQLGGRGRTYVIFGSRAFAPVIDLEEIDSTNGFIFEAGSSGDDGDRVARAGDLNGDGLQDVVIGAPGVDIGFLNDVGEAYVIFGSAEPYSDETIFPWMLDGHLGFTIAGLDANDRLGRARGIGDFNGDGIDDVAVGAIQDGNSGDPGTAYVVFGQLGGFPSRVVAEELNGTDGFAIRTEESGALLGYAVAGLGDFNGDGVDDLAIGSRTGNVIVPLKLRDSSETLGFDDTGAVYVLFGSSGSFAPAFAVEALDGGNGFALHGVELKSFLGETVAGPGDINGDGLTDLVAAAPSDDGFGDANGAVYAVFGRSELELDISSAVCPGPGDITVSGGTPGADVAVIWSADLGASSLPQGICDDLDLSLSPSRRLVRKLTIDASGFAFLSGNVPSGSCGGFIQAVDLTACRKSAARRLPES